MLSTHMGVSKIGVPQNGWFIMENLITLDDLGATTIFGNIHIVKSTLIPPANEGIPFTKLTALPTCTETREIRCPQLF